MECMSFPIHVPVHIQATPFVPFWTDAGTDTLAGALHCFAPVYEWLHCSSFQSAARLNRKCFTGQSTKLKKIKRKIKLI